jgi:hypothetical protein
MKNTNLSQKVVRATSVLLLLLSFGVVATAQRGYRWEYLGSANVDGGVDHDLIQVSTPDKFRALQLGIENGAIEFQRVVAHFENGESQELRIRQRIPAGGRTRAIDLRGEKRHVRSVEFWYAKANWRSAKPKVNLYGVR